MGQFKKQKIKNLENDSDWYIILLIMLLLLGNFIDKCIESAGNNPWSAIGVFIAFFLLLWRIIIWSRKRYLISYPFKIDFSDENPYFNGEIHFTKRQRINGIHSLFLDTVILRIGLKIERDFEQINIRLTKKRYFSKKYFAWEFLKPMFWHWEDIRAENLVHIEKIIDLRIKNSPRRAIGEDFFDEDDLRGGRDGYYKPTYSCPKGGYLWYAIKLYINPNINKWQGHISFQHLRGNSNRAYGRGKIIIKNTNLELKECP